MYSRVMCHKTIKRRSHTLSFFDLLFLEVWLTPNILSRAVAAATSVSVARDLLLRFTDLSIAALNEISEFVVVIEKSEDVIFNLIVFFLLFFKNVYLNTRALNIFATLNNSKKQKKHLFSFPFFFVITNLKVTVKILSHNNNVQLK